MVYHIATCLKSNTYFQVIFLIGPSGTGKTTQGQKVAKHLGLQFISTDSLLRNAVLTRPADDDFGIKAKAALQAGVTEIPDTLLFALLAEALPHEVEKRNQKGVLLQGTAQHFSISTDVR